MDCMSPSPMKAKKKIKHANFPDKGKKEESPNYNGGVHYKHNKLKLSIQLIKL